MKAYTDIEQSRKLLALGIPAESADMYYFRQVDNDYFPPNVESICPTPQVKDNKYNAKYDIPAWSLAALLELMPKIKDSCYRPFIGRSLEKEKKFICVYDNGIRFEHITGPYENAVDAAFEMIVKLKENKYI